ncbi:MAG: M28 family peptidase [Chitinophagaceae bacterium]|nr:MAG: M28 family peptidase [Chitinophagaceae bacterium]
MPLTYRIEKRPMKRNTWEPVNAVVTIVGETTPLIQFKTNRNMLPINVLSTPPGGVTAEVVFLNNATKPTPENVKGKIAFSETAGATRLYSAAIAAGAVGAMGYSMPAYTKPEINQTSIQFNSLNATATAGWAINLSYAVKERLKAAIAKGPVKLHVEIETKSYPSEELTIIANIAGSIRSAQRFVYSAHVQEPGANDNATGVGTLAEMARLSAQLYKAGKIRPERTITFLWGDEIVSTGRYITDDKERAAGILWGMSLDMVGENTAKTGGTFLLEKMPDPSAIWTRGADKHSEWGGSPIKEESLFPHYYNDFIFNILEEQGKFAKWEVKFNPFEGGSDHTPFLQNKIPGLLMWHFTDQFYHTDNDRIDKVSATTMKNVGVSALTAGLLLASATENTAVSTINTLLAAATERLNTEFELGKKNIAAGMPADKERHIIEVWGKYYTDAMATVSTMPVTKETTKLGSTIKFGINQVEKQAKAYIDQMK